MPYSYTTFIRPTSSDVNIKIYDITGELTYTINPFSVINTQVTNNLVRINLKELDDILLDFDNPTESKMALQMLQSQLNILRQKSPLFIDDQIKSYVNSVTSDGIQGPQGPIGLTGISGVQGNNGIGLTGFQGFQGNDGVGLTGNNGLQGSQGNSGVSLNWRGDYDTSGNGEYNINDVVSYQGSAYICTLDGTAGDPISFPGRWGLLVQSGSQGPQGPISQSNIGEVTVFQGPGAGTNPQFGIISNGKILKLTILTGTSSVGSNAIISTLSLQTPLSYNIIPIISPANGNAVTSGVYIDSTDTSNINIISGTDPLIDSTEYVFNILI